MAEILLDVNGWQSLFDFAGGEPKDIPDERPDLALAQRIAAEHPYPGDTNPDSFKWVTDTALDLYRSYSPDFFFLSYANTNLIKVNTETDADAYRTLNKLAVSEAMRFAETTGYTPILVSTGDMKKFENIIDTENLESYLSLSTGDPYTAGLFEPTEKDLAYIERLEGLSFEKKESFCKKYPSMTEAAKEGLPDVMLFADEHYAFTRCGYRGLTMQVMPVKQKYCTAYSTFDDLPDDIFDFRAYIDKKLDEGHRIALIVIECVEEEDMPEGAKRVNRYKNGAYYIEGTGFYYALCSSKEFFEPDMPYLFHNTNLVNRSERMNPFSYIRSDNYQNPLGLRPDKKTAAVGTRSGITHSCLMCDFCVECHSRGLAESGVLVFLNDKERAI